MSEFCFDCCRTPIESGYSCKSIPPCNILQFKWCLQPFLFLISGIPLFMRKTLLVWSKICKFWSSKIDCFQYLSLRYLCEKKNAAPTHQNKKSASAPFNGLKCNQSYAIISLMFNIVTIDWSDKSFYFQLFCYYPKTIITKYPNQSVFSDTVQSENS